MTNQYKSKLEAIVEDKFALIGQAKEDEKIKELEGKIDALESELIEKIKEVKQERMKADLIKKLIEDLGEWLGLDLWFLQLFVELINFKFELSIDGFGLEERVDAYEKEKEELKKSNESLK